MVPSRSCGASTGAQQSRLRYDDLSDPDIVDRAQSGDNPAAEYLLYKHSHLVRARITAYFLIGAEREDLAQVGMIGLWQAIMDYRSDRSASFASFANLCITRHILTAIKAATRRKQAPLNSAQSLDSAMSIFDGEHVAVFRFSSGHHDHSADPEALILRREESHTISDQLNSMLSPFELDVLGGYQSGKSYQEIAAELGCKPKSIDNALGRIKRKMATPIHRPVFVGESA